MDSDSARSRLEELGLSDEQISEIIPLIVREGMEAPPKGVPRALSEEGLRTQLAVETDPAKRLVLAAKVISESFS